MKVVDRKIYEEAVELARKISLRCSCVDFVGLKLCCCMDLIFLDQWKRRPKWRLTYLGQAIGNCSNKCCTNCMIFQTVGGEDVDDESELVTTLYIAEQKDLDNYDGKQRCLNCKSVDQYINSFVSCFLSECHDRESMLDELDYVVGFKVVYSRFTADWLSLEKMIKQRIIKECLSKYSEYSEKERAIFAAAVLEVGLPESFIK